MQWILALDDDELVHPAGGSSYSLTSLLKDIHPNTDAVLFLNHVFHFRLKLCAMYVSHLLYMKMQSRDISVLVLLLRAIQSKEHHQNNLCLCRKQ